MIRIIMIQFILKKSNDLLSGMKRYLRIEHQEDDKELREYLQKQAGLHRE
jgi:hypothetical protein